MTLTDLMKTKAGCETVEGVEGGKLPSGHDSDGILLVNLGLEGGSGLQLRMIIVDSETLELR